MKDKNRKKDYNSTIAIATSATAIIMLLGLFGFFEQPKIYPGYYCPKEINEYFSLSFSNRGKGDAHLCVNVSSASKEINFTQKEISCYLIDPNKEPVELKFNLEVVPFLTNETIINVTYEYFYVRYFLSINQKKECHYIQKERGYPELKLIT